MDKYEKFTTGTEVQVADMVEQLLPLVKEMGDSYSRKRRQIAESGGNSDHWPDEKYDEYLRRGDIGNASNSAAKALQELKEALKRG